mmetsp:Transcript_84333/g.131679  ORF Transcript_84333/g.131679 Transcript_84333/m.131679 type:complete len:201 (-) Transcript_84333:2093-2695(-)
MQSRRDSSPGNNFCPATVPPKHQKSCAIVSAEERYCGAEPRLDAEAVVAVGSLDRAFFFCDHAACARGAFAFPVVAAFARRQRAHHPHGIPTQTDSALRCSDSALALPSILRTATGAAPPAEKLRFLVVKRCIERQGTIIFFLSAELQLASAASLLFWLQHTTSCTSWASYASTHGVSSWRLRPHCCAISSRLCFRPSSG